MRGGRHLLVAVLLVLSGATACGTGTAPGTAPSPGPPAPTAAPSPVALTPAVNGGPADVCMLLDLAPLLGTNRLISQSTVGEYVGDPTAAPATASTAPLDTCGYVISGDKPLAMTVGLSMLPATAQQFAALRTSLRGTPLVTTAVDEAFVGENEAVFARWRDVLAAVPSASKSLGITDAQKLTLIEGLLLKLPVPYPYAPLNAPTDCGRVDKAKIAALQGAPGLVDITIRPKAAMTATATPKRVTGIAAEAYLNPEAQQAWVQTTNQTAVVFVTRSDQTSFDAQTTPFSQVTPQLRALLQNIADAMKA